MTRNGIQLLRPLLRGSPGHIRSQPRIDLHPLIPHPRSVADDGLAPEETLPQVVLVHHLPRDPPLAHEPRQRGLLHLQRVRDLEVGVQQLGRRLLGLALQVAAHVLHPPLHREVVDGLLDGALHDVQPHRGLVLLPDAVYARDCL